MSYRCSVTVGLEWPRETQLTGVDFQSKRERLPTQTGTCYGFISFLFSFFLILIIDYGQKKVTDTIECKQNSDQRKKRRSAEKEWVNWVWEEEAA